MPRELKKSKYRGSTKKCFYPQGLLTTLFRLGANIPVTFEFRRKMSELATVARLLGKLCKDSVVADI